MHLIFGFGLDGYTYPEHPGDQRGSVGAAVVGPEGLVDILATALGLGFAPVSAVARTAVWLTKLEAAEARSPRFWSASFGAAAWATATRLLKMRDELIEAGWSPAADIMCPRLTDLAAAETAGSQLPRSRADLFQEIKKKLDPAPRFPNPTLIELVDAWEDLPQRWQRLLTSLRSAAVEVKALARPPIKRSENDLARLCTYLDDGQIARLTGDGSVLVLRSPQAVTAADVTAEWLASDNGETEKVVIAEEGDTYLLDCALHRRGLPMLGLSAHDRHRGALAILPLSFAVVMRPPDPKRVLDLLAHPALPIEGWAVRKLTAALLQQPAFEGVAWEKAWDTIKGRLLSDLPEAEARSKLADWRDWLAIGIHECSEPIPRDDALRICERVSKAATTRSNAGDLTWTFMAVAADGLAAAIEALDRSAIDVTIVRAMVEAALSTGVPSPDREAEAGSLRSISSPAALWGPTDTVVWWRFAMPSAAQPTAWRSAERRALAAAGFALDGSDAEWRRAEAAHERAVRNATGRILIVVPAADRGIALGAHPFAQRIAPLLADGNATRVEFDMRILQNEPFTRLAGCDLRREATLPLRLPEPRIRWSIPANVAGRADARTESASSLTELASCQLRWGLHRLLGLRVRSELRPPDNERLLGDLAHALAHHAIPVGVRPEPASVLAEATRHFDTALAMVAAPLALAGLSAERAFARRTIPASLAQLARVLDRAGYVVEASEVWSHETIDGIDVRSRLDFVLRNVDGSRAVIDLKWTHDPERRRSEVEAGEAVQLATYARLLGHGIAAGYYLVSSRRFLAAAPMPLPTEPLELRRSLDETWSAVAADWTALAAYLASGRLHARGVAGAADELPDLSAITASGVCRLCGFGGICRVDAKGAAR